MVGDGINYPLQPRSDITQTYDGTGAPAKRVQLTRLPNPFDDEQPPREDTQTTFYLRSTVLDGAVVVEFRPGAVDILNIYAGGQRIARDTGGVMFEQTNPVTGTRVISHGHSGNRATNKEERDSFGAEIPNSNPYPSSQKYVDYKFGEQMYIEGGDPFDYSTGREIDGLPVSEAEFQRRVGNESIVGDVFTGGRYIGSINLSRTISYSRVRFTFDVYRPSMELTNYPELWYSYYSHSVEVEVDLPGAQTKPNQKPTGRHLTTDESNSLLSDLKKLISDTDCANFIRSLLSQLKTDTGRQQHGTTDVLQLFEAVKNGRGFDWDPNLGDQARGGGGPGNASITIKPSLAFANLNNKSHDSTVYRARTLIHELFHVAGYGHDAMALAAYNMGERFDSKWRPWTGDFPNPQDKFFQTEDPKEAAARLDGAYSGFFGNVLNQHCK